jgi:hypothetical protein
VKAITTTAALAAVLAVPLTGCASNLIPAPAPNSVGQATMTAASLPPAPSPAISYNAEGAIYPVAACTAVQGITAEDLDARPICTEIPYLGTDGQRYYATVGIAPNASLEGPASTEGVGATAAECTSGWYPELDGVGPGSGPVGEWDSVLGLCLP